VERVDQGARPGHHFRNAHAEHSGREWHGHAGRDYRARRCAGNSQLSIVQVNAKDSQQRPIQMVTSEAAIGFS